MGCISVGVSLWWGGGYGGCKRGFLATVDVARNSSDSLLVLTGKFCLSESLEANTRINVFVIGHSAFCCSLPCAFLIQLRYLTMLFNADITWCR